MSSNPPKPFPNTRQPDWGWWSKLWPTPGGTLRRLGIESATTMVEAGCGNGYFALPAARITKPGSVYAIDLDEDLLAELARLAERQEIKNVIPIHGDVRSLTDLVPKAVDVVFIANTFHGVDAKETFVEKAYDILRPGGRLIIVNWAAVPRENTPVDGSPSGPPEDVRLTPSETQKIVTSPSDFVLERHVKLPPYHYGFIYKR